MIPVCKDIEANGEASFWFFSEGVYVRLQRGQERARITGKNLPDPMLLWKQRCEANGAQWPCNAIVNPASRGQEIRLKPTPAAFALFDHWQGAQHASLNH